MIKENWETQEKKLEILQKVCEILFFPDQDLGRGGNEYLLKYYLFYAWFNFTCYHLPWATLGQVQPFRPGSGELFEAVLSRGEGGVGANKKNIFFLILRSTGYFSRGLHDGCGLQDYIF